MRKLIDAHTHFHRENIPDMLRTMDLVAMEYAVNLGWVLAADEAMDLIKYTREFTGGRIATLSNFGYDGMDRPGYVAGLVDRFRREVDAGAKGLKVLKRLGLSDRYATGGFVRVDDERLDPLWSAAGELGVPVLIHTADPISAWLPLDENNPRLRQYEKDKTHYYADGAHFPRLELLAQRDRVVERHPNTIFVNAHWGCYPEDTDRLVALLARYPNFYADTEPSKIRMTPAGMAHPSRRRIMLDHADRMLYGTDLFLRRGQRMDHAWNREMYDSQRSYFETANEEGLELPPAVLDKFYCENAKRIYRLGQ